MRLGLPGIISSSLVFLFCVTNRSSKIGRSLGEHLQVVANLHRYLKTLFVRFFFFLSLKNKCLESKIVFTTLNSFQLLWMKCYCKCKFWWLITLNYCSERLVQRILEVFLIHCTRNSVSISRHWLHVFKRTTWMGHWKQVFGCLWQISHLRVYDGRQ